MLKGRRVVARGYSNGDDAPIAYTLPERRAAGYICSQQPRHHHSLSSRLSLPSVDNRSRPAVARLSHDTAVEMAVPGLTLRYWSVVADCTIALGVPSMIAGQPAAPLAAFLRSTVGSREVRPLVHCG